MDSPKYRLRTFGPMTLESGGQPVSGLASQRKRLALLALLAVAGDLGVARDKILALLWPESDDTRARNTLNQFLHVLRRELGDIVVSASGRLVLNPDVVTTDVREFRERLARGEFACAVQLYRGPFLDGLYLREAPEFERWLETERGDLATAYAGALERLASAADAAGDRGACVQWWRMRANADPLSARVALAYMQALVAAGEPEAAIQHARVHHALVRAELDAAPDADIERYLNDLTTRGAIKHPVVPNAAPSADVPVGPKPVTSEWRDDPRTVGEARSLMSRASGSRGWSVAALICTLVIAGGIAASRTTPHSPERGRLPVVLIAPFDAASADTALVRVARVAEQMVVDAITQSGLIGVVDADMVTRHVIPRPRATGAGDSGSLTMADLSARVGARLVVDTRLECSGDSLEFRSHVVDATTGAVVSNLPPVRFATLEDPSAALQELAERVLGAVAVAVDPQVASLRDRTAQSPRYDAYREYVDGLDAFVGRWSDQSDYAGALTHFARAVALDSTFNAPYVWMAFAYGYAVAPVELIRQKHIPGRDSVLALLQRRRNHLSPLEALALDYFRANAGTGIARCQKAYQVAQRGVELAPGSQWTYLVGYFAPCVGRIEEAVTAFRLLEGSHSWLLRWAPFWTRYSHVMDLSGQQDSALAVARRGARQSTDILAYGAIVEHLGANGDVRAIDRLLDSLSSVSPSITGLRFGPGRWLATAAQEAAVHDHDASASQLAERCVAWYQRHPVGQDQPVQFRNLGIMVEANCASQLGRWKDADSLYQQLPSNDDQALGLRALVALKEGDQSHYRTLVAELHRRAARETTATWLDVDIAAVSGQPREMVEKLKQAYAVMPAVWHQSPAIHRALRNQPALRSLLPPSQ